MHQTGKRTALKVGLVIRQTVLWLQTLSLLGWQLEDFSEQYSQNKAASSARAGYYQG